MKSKKIKQITRTKKKWYKKKGNITNDKLLPPDYSGEEADEELFSVTNSSTAASNTSSENDCDVFSVKWRFMWRVVSLIIIITYFSFYSYENGFCY